MANKKQKLELTWIGKENRPRLEPRILLEDPEKSYHAEHRVTDNDIFDNMLIHGDNLLALKALEQDLAGQVKSIFIDPPYNTGSAFEHYDDGIEHSLWLSLMAARLYALKKLLRKDGLIWITLDDTEAHYCKVLGDEVFGRRNFLADVVWEKADSPRMDAKYFSSRHDHLLVFAKDISNFVINRIKEDVVPDHYNKEDEQGRRYYLKPLRAMGADGHRAKRPSMYFPITAPDGEQVYPMNPDGSDSRWRWGLERVKTDSERLEWVKTKKGWSLYFRIYHESSKGTPPETVWFNSDVGSNRTSKAEIKALFGSDVFDTPKPEALLQRALEISTSPGDLVLDSFLGSGTTAAVAHKMGRRWIGIELGDHCETHCLPRLKKVVDGEDHGGITKAVNWQGGGGFRYYKLASTLITTDKWGNEVINPDFNPAMLAEAVCKIEGFKYAPDPDLFWKQGFSTERDFIYVTTQHLNRQQLSFLSEEVGEQTTLLVCCGSFTRGSDTVFENLTIKKLPKAVLKRCEWGHDDYSLKVENLPKAPEPARQTEMDLD